MDSQSKTSECSGVHACQLSFQASGLVVQTMAPGWDRPTKPVRPGTVTEFTGTILWAPLSVLQGNEHTVSSMLEGLFISVLSISCNGRLYARDEMNPDRLHDCAFKRRGHLTSSILYERHTIQVHLKPLIEALHNLFYPIQDAEGRGYNTKVTVKQVQGVCVQVCGALSM